MITFPNDQETVTNYSIIIPHKNTPAFLQECLNSIPVRNDVQVIVVDDNSDANKVDFSNFPQWTGAHYEYYLTKEGRGAGYARNVGLEHAIGKWLVFADADDYFMPEFAKAMDEFVDSECEMVFFKGYSIVRANNQPGFRTDSINEQVDIALRDNDYRYLFTNTCPWCKFYRSSFIEENNIRFHEVRWSNDVYFGALCAAKAVRFVASDQVIYCATSTDGSLTTNRSVECLKVRCIEAREEMRLLYPKFRDFEYMEYWNFRTWLNLWRVGKLEAVRLLPSCIRANNGVFLKYLIHTIVIGLYNSSFFLKKIVRIIKSKK